MYVRVHKTGNKWFRDDNGTLVGTENFKNSKIYRRLGNPVNQTIVKNSNHELKTIYYGHFVNNKFIRLNFHSSDSTSGFYTFVLD